LLSALKEHGSVVGGPPLAAWEERQALVRKDFFDALGDRYQSEPMAPG
jgi:hypothetical protein